MSGRAAHTIMVPCAKPECTAEFPDHRWGHIRAHSDGWFEEKDGNRWCPEHTPEWVESWRAGQGVAKPKTGTVLLTATCVGCVQVIRKPVGEGHTWVHEFTGEPECE